MDSFWLGAGTVAGIAAAIAALLGLRASRSRIVADAKRYPLKFPEYLVASHDAIRRALLRLHPDTPQFVDDTYRTRVALELLEQLDAMTRARPAYSFAHDVDEYWEIGLTNRGHAKAEEVSLDIPGARFATVTRQARDATSIEVREVIELGDLRPGENVEIAVWANRPLARKPGLLQKSGTATLRQHEMLGPVLARLGRVWEYGWPLILATIVSLVLLLVLQLL